MQTCTVYLIRAANRVQFSAGFLPGERALHMAYTLRGEVPDGVVFQADRGTQFTSEQLWQVCQELGIAQLVGRTGVCFDNAMAEAFWSTLKTGFYDRKKWRTRDEARKAVVCWIEIVSTGAVATRPWDNQPRRFRSPAR